MQEDRNVRSLLGAYSLEMRLLMALVGHSLGGAPPAIPALTPTGWERLLELAAAHRVQPLAYAVLKAFPAEVPAEVISHLKSQRDQAWMHSKMLAQEIGRVSRLLTDGGIALVTLKGPALGAQVYGSSAARAMRDLDILIRPADFQKARSLLEANGFVWDETTALLTAEAQNVLARSVTHFEFRHFRLGYLLEVHLRAFSVSALLPISLNELFADAEWIDLEGVPVPTLSPWHHFLFVAAHGVKHGWHRLSWLADFAAFLTRYPDWFSEPDAAKDHRQQIRVLGLQRVLAASFWMSHLCFETSLPQSGNALPPLAAYGLQTLIRGRPPITAQEKFGELRQLLRIRADFAYRLSVLLSYLQITREDIVRFPLPKRLRNLYPVLHPLLWTLRKISP